MVFTNGYFSWNSVVLSSYVRAIRLTLRQTEVNDNDTMGVAAERVIRVLQTYDLEVEFKQDFGASAPEQSIAADHIAGTARAWAARPDAGAIATTNPEYQGTGYASEYEPINGAFGEVLGTRLRIRSSIATAIVRDITP
jgi:hypothetical protein